MDFHLKNEVGMIIMPNIQEKGGDTMKKKKAHKRKNKSSLKIRFWGFELFFKHIS